jgi:acyl-coenzyme A synthetase/AMP-(fatty) acid ligase
VPVGFPFSQQHLRIIDRTGKPVLPGQAGELCLAGPQVVSGYWRQPALTATRFVRFAEDAAQLVWYRTQDWVRWSERFGVIWLGRLDDQFKVRGCCVLRNEVEQALARVARTASVAVIVWPPRITAPTQSLIAFVAHSPHSAADILARARKNLPDYYVPDRLIVIKQLPRNANGKTDYHKLQHYLGKQDEPSKNL